MDKPRSPRAAVPHPAPQGVLPVAGQAWGAPALPSAALPPTQKAQTLMPTLTTPDWAVLASLGSVHTATAFPRCPNLIARHRGSDAYRLHLQCHCPCLRSPLALGSERESHPEPPQACVMAQELRTLRRRRPPRSCGGGSGASAGCSQTPRGRSCGPRRKRPCHHSSWMRSSGCPRAARAGELLRGRATGPGEGERRWHSPRSPGSWLCTSPATSA